MQPNYPDSNTLGWMIEVSRAQNTTVKLKAVPFVPSFQKVEKDVWTDNGVRTVRESLSVYQNTA